MTGTSLHVYRCNACHQTVESKGWGAHINGNKCAQDAAIYQQGFDDAMREVEDRLDRVTRMILGRSSD